MSGIFISYRRDDQPGFAGRLADALAATFGADQVFRDIEDIRPGDDFVVTIQNQLRSVDVILVLIGPDWLSLSKNGVRRLDETEDFVRMEIQAGLESGKAMLPVLVDGASMPAEKDLPAAIGALARRQSFALTDSGWTSEVARLVEAIKPFLPRRRRLSMRPALAWGLAAGALTGLLLLGLQASWIDRSASIPGQAAMETTQNLSGRWTAEVKYDWGAIHTETFDLRLENGEVHGTASYLRLARTVQQGQLRAEQLSFITHSQEVLGDAPPREVTHRYRGVFKQGELNLVLESTGGHSPHTPVRFVARRSAE